jgi:fumarate hydratase class II
LDKTDTSDFRIERDTMGEVRVPSTAYYGAQTQRAVENFPMSGLRFHSGFIQVLGLIKLAAANVNMKLGLLDMSRGEAIVKACQEVVDGLLDDQFVVDVFQTGSGTSTNMNANEVIANRAAEILSHKKNNNKIIHPNDHINMCQSTNDVFPTAINISALKAMVNDLLPALRALESSLGKKALEFDQIIKAARTHLQDAVPMTLGQEFSGYASMITHAIRRIEEVRNDLAELPIGGTAVGTGLNAHPKFAELVVEEINRLSGLRFRRAENTFEAMQSRDSNVEASGTLRTLSVSLMKISNDLKLLYSGPRTGFYELELPAIQPGSSIMPGKVNPVIPESVSMIAARVMGNDTTIFLAGQFGVLDLNTMMPIIAYCLLESINILTSALREFTKCIDGVKPFRERCLKYAEDTVALITVLAPVIGYDKAAAIAKKSMESGKTIRELVVEEGILSRKEVDKILDLKRISKGGRI